MRRSGADRSGPSPSKLDPYKGIIGARLVAYPKLSAVWLFREVRPREPEEPVRRFETPPGHQGQVDFADFRLPWGRRHALVVVLGYSRLMWLGYYERQTMRVVMRGLESSFVYFGGVPSELLFDRMKAVVTADRRAEGGRLLENGEFLRFSHHWGFQIRACRPYRAQTEFVSDADLNARARRWVEDEANVRIHGTLKERPADRFERERPYLTPLAAQPYRSLAAPPQPEDSTTREATPPKIVEVERRPLAEYAKIAGGVS
ncbi:DDE-type integrase/transposase/recombinase [Candidatus Palauibacter sp.]|uniref:DDE-type integrase/transposase/recombinase n=1 Tax=Candidatus Palauibacter sp. TaxID=3101350 RepID=UPI003B01AD39